MPDHGRLNLIQLRRVQVPNDISQQALDDIDLSYGEPLLICDEDGNNKYLVIGDITHTKIGEYNKIAFTSVNNSIKFFTTNDVSAVPVAEYTPSSSEVRIDPEKLQVVSSSNTNNMSVVTPSNDSDTTRIATVGYVLNKLSPIPKSYGYPVYTTQPSPWNSEFRTTVSTSTYTFDLPVLDDTTYSKEIRLSLLTTSNCTLQFTYNGSSITDSSQVKILNSGEYASLEANSLYEISVCYVGQFTISGTQKKCIVLTGRQTSV